VIALTWRPGNGLIPRQSEALPRFGQFQAIVRLILPQPVKSTSSAQVAQLVEQRTENPRVGGSIPPLGTISSEFEPQTQVSGLRLQKRLLTVTLGGVL
jgi:hypothetical protein